MDLRMATLLALALAAGLAARGDAEGPEAPEPPRTRQALEAAAGYQEAVAAARQQFDQRVETARDLYLRRMDSAIRDATRRGEHEEVTRLTALLERTREPEGLDDLPRMTVFLSDLEHFNVHAAGAWFGKKGEARVELKIMVDGRYSPNGISAHPPTNGASSVQFHLDGNFRHFITQAAINDSSTGSRTPLTFVVMGDGKRLWESKPVRRPAAVEACSVPVSGVRVLELRVECPGRHDEAHAVWLEPRVLR